MSTPNPLVPQGSLLEQQAKSKSTFQVAAFIVALHVVILGGLLFLGCKKEEKGPANLPTDSLITPPAVSAETNIPPADPFAIPTNAVVATPEPLSNPIAPVVTTPLTPPVVPSAPVETVASGGATSEHVVQKGEIAAKIARSHGVTLKQMQDANPGIDLAKLKINQKLQIPAAATASTGSPTDVGGGSGGGAVASGGTQATHTVKGGDNLSRISKKYGVTVKEIRAANGLKSNDIKVGQKLKIPSHADGAKGASGSAPAPEASQAQDPLPTVNPVQPTKP
ncbi:MAG: LysM peptidoglycan-binding domain-containing protein [Verrucomicrobiales bacterium]|nr:LysM peptidoglycan-binding domain-containing protein [Verrucomicrobiales bacterium]